MGMRHLLARPQPDPYMSVHFSFHQLQFQAEDPQEGAAPETCTPSPLRTLCTVGVNHATIAQMLQRLLCGPCRLQHLHVTRPSR